MSGEDPTGLASTTTDSSGCGPSAPPPPPAPPAAPPEKITVQGHGGEQGNPAAAITKVYGPSGQSHTSGPLFNAVNHATQGGPNSPASRSLADKGLSTWNSTSTGEAGAFYAAGGAATQISITIPPELEKLFGGAMSPYTMLMDLAEAGGSVVKWRELGLLGEQAVREKLIANGYDPVAEQLYMRVPLGLRVTDFLVRFSGGLAGFEAKVNGSPYTTMQMLKDDEIARGLGTVASRSNPNFNYGQSLQYKTYLLNVITP